VPNNIGLPSNLNVVWHTIFYFIPEPEGSSGIHPSNVCITFQEL